jgi:hypothetical protein
MRLAVSIGILKLLGQVKYLETRRQRSHEDPSGVPTARAEIHECRQGSPIRAHSEAKTKVLSISEHLVACSN